ncbi:MAG: glycosyltransferase family 4 protein [Prevotella sp.]|nr:glycosyltransferase family 4 protein [Prevotella sp.]
MKIAVLTSGILPVPAVQGGAVENLVDFYLEYNDQHQLHDITVYSVWHPDVEQHPARQSGVNHYIYIKVNTLANRTRKCLFSHLHKDGYYHHSIEYFLWKAIQRIKKEHYDLIIVENRPGFVLMLKQSVMCPVVLHLHNGFLNPDTKNAQEIFDGYQHIISVSDFITAQVNSINPAIRKCSTVYNAIDLQHFYSSPSYPRERVGIVDEDFLLVYSGRLREEKGILPLIQAVKKLDTIPHLKLLIIGASGYGKGQQPSPFVLRLTAECESISSQVVFTGFIDYHDVPSYLKMADVAVVPSMWEEPFGLTVVEAMAVGLPLITTRSGGIPEICQNVATIVERDHIADNLAAAILDLYEHPEKRKQMAAASLERSKLFDKETYAKNVFAALEKLETT